MAQPVTRRDILQAGSAAMTVALWQLVTPDFLFAQQAADEQLVPFLNMPRTPPNRLDWEALEEWITPQDQAGGSSSRRPQQ